MRYLIIVFILLPLTTKAQIKFHADSSYYFEEVYKVELNKQEIRKKTSEWLALNFNNSNNVVKLNSVDKIITKANLGGPDKDFDLIVEFKEGRYKILINNIEKLHKPKDYDIYYKNGKMIDYDKFLELSREMLMREGVKEKYINKVIKNDNLMKISYSTTSSHFGDWNSTNQSIKTKIKRMALSLYSYINTENQSQNDW